MSATTLRLARENWGGPFNCSSQPSRVVQSNRALIERIELRLRALAAHNEEIDVEATILQIRNHKDVDIHDPSLQRLIEEHYSLWSSVLGR